jgi:hypothetical protein
LLALSLGVACGSSGSAGARVNPTYVEVDPAEFTTEVPCAPSDGGLRWYVATLIDVTPDENGEPLGFRLPSSPPTECARSVFFSGVVSSGRTQGVPHRAHRYTAEIEGYTQAALRPTHEGSRVMTSAGRAAEPGWLYLPRSINFHDRLARDLAIREKDNG